MREFWDHTEFRVLGPGPLDWLEKWLDFRELPLPILPAPAILSVSKVVMIVVVYSWLRPDSNSSLQMSRNLTARVTILKAFSNMSSNVASMESGSTGSIANS